MGYTGLQATRVVQEMDTLKTSVSKLSVFYWPLYTVRQYVIRLIQCFSVQYLYGKHFLPSLKVTHSDALG